MATTVSNFSAIDDNEVDAESPITESMVTRLRDNAYWIDPASTRTAATSNTLVLTPNQSAGTTQWQEVADIATLDGTKGVFSGSILNSASSWTLITTSTNGMLMLNLHQSSSGDGLTWMSLKVDLSDDSFVASSTILDSGSAIIANSGSTSGTFGAGNTTISSIRSTTGTTISLYCRRSGGNLELATSSLSAVGCAFDWIIL